MYSGQLRCPNCHNLGMSGYLYYESGNLKNGQTYWIFYNRETQHNGWKCWALMDVCGCTIHHWYDPCGCCFNPCDLTPDRVTYVDGVEVHREKDCATGMCWCLVFLFLCYIIYALYFGLYFWYDLYYYYCKGSQKMKVIFTGKGDVLIPEGNIYYSDKNGNTYTEQYWCTYYPTIFICRQCNHCARSFKEFIEINQAPSSTVNIVAQNNFPNSNSN